MKGLKLFWTEIDGSCMAAFANKTDPPVLATATKRGEFWYPDVAGVTTSYRTLAEIRATACATLEECQAKCEEMFFAKKN